jgi:CYTH domain-containing protein
MALEIERKYLVNNKFTESILKNRGTHIWQSYLFSENNKSIRIRQKGEKAFITIKAGDNPLIRKEFEYEIPLTDVLELKELFANAPCIEKTRYLFLYEGNTWEIDIFSGANEGLILCEIELNSESQQFVKPDWVGEEVTFDIRYLNSNLAINPYTNWKQV